MPRASVRNKLTEAIPNIFGHLPAEKHIEDARQVVAALGRVTKTA